MKAKLVVILGVCLFFACVDKSKIQRVGGFKLSLENSKNGNTVRVIDCKDDDYVKYGALSELILDRVQANQNTAFYFSSRDGNVDSLIYSAKEIASLRQLYKKYPCVLDVCNYIVSEMSDDKIQFYDKVLYDIMLYDSKLNNIDTSFYAKRDVSIVSILYNRCLYNKKSPPKEFEIQAKYFEVLPIWCENKASFPLYDQKDFVIK